MPDELTNLLPPERARALRRDYALRVSVVAIAAMTALTLAAAVLLLPTSVLLSSSASAKRAHLATLTAASPSASDAALAARLAVLASRAGTLSALADTPSVSSLTRTVLAVTRPGVTLSGFSYAPATGKDAAAFVVSGVAQTRDALRSYQLALQGMPSVRSVSLPVSAYAKDADITFSITVALSP